jgi:hypothetical protein
MQMLMEDLGYYPYKDEDDMIAKSFVSDDLYLEAKDKVPTRPSKTNCNCGKANEA